MNANQVFTSLANIIKIGEQLHEYNYWELIEKPLQEAQKEGRFPEYSIESGASKICILVKGLNDVFKIPFTHYYSDESYDDYLEDLANEGIIPRDTDGYPDPSNYDIDEDRFYYEFEFASNHKLNSKDGTITGQDYCALECAYYQEAVNADLAQYFAAERRIGYINSFPIYKQQRAIPFVDYKEIDWDDEKTSKRASDTENKCKQLQIYCFNPLWIADFLDMYGEEEFKRLNDFLIEFDIGDLRASNIGYLDGAPILFDYSGYNEW